MDKRKIFSFLSWDDCFTTAEKLLNIETEKIEQLPMEYLFNKDCNEKRNRIKEAFIELCLSKNQNLDMSSCYIKGQHYTSLNPASIESVQTNGLLCLSEQMKSREGTLFEFLHDNNIVIDLDKEQTIQNGKTISMPENVVQKLHNEDNINFYIFEPLLDEVISEYKYAICPEILQRFENDEIIEMWSRQHKPYKITCLVPFKDVWHFNNTVTGEFESKEHIITTLAKSFYDSFILKDKSDGHLFTKKGTGIEAANISIDAISLERWIE